MKAESTGEPNRDRSRRATVSSGADGLRQALADGDLPVIVDVLRFSSTVTTAIANGFTIVPAATRQEALERSRIAGTTVSGSTGSARYSLSPLDYLNPRSPEEVILISPNGAALSCSVEGEAFGFIACFLNARAAGRLLRGISEQTQKGIALIAAGEAAEDRDQDQDRRRFALEDYLGCGSILCELRMQLSSEAIVCCRAFEACKQDYPDLIRQSLSGEYLARRGLLSDLSHCVQRDLYGILPIVRYGIIVPYEDGSLGT